MRSRSARTLAETIVPRENRHTGKGTAMNDRTSDRTKALDAAAALLATDSDFRVYRRNGRQAIPLLFPE